MRRFRLHAFGLIVHLVLALLRVALVNFTLNEYMIWDRTNPIPSQLNVRSTHYCSLWKQSVTQAITCMDNDDKIRSKKSTTRNTKRT